MKKSVSALFERKFTAALANSPGKSVYDLFEYKRVDAYLTNYSTGEVIVDMRDLEFPENYSKNCCNIIASKYFRKAGCNTPTGGENSMKQVADRMVGFWADALREEGLIENDEQYAIFYDELVFALLSQMWAPNSPQWFNTGLKRNYNIEADNDELYYYDPDLRQVVMAKDRYTRTQASACFILSIRDTLIGEHSISEQYVTETKLFKGGSGVGTNYSDIRGVNEALSSGGFSSGVMSFLKGLDRNAGAIKSGGTTRRAAKMVILDVDHPEIEDFISWKAKEEDKVRALAKMGYDTGMDGEAYSTVSGQNGNNSVRMNGEFMKKVMGLKENPDETIKLKGRVDSRVDKKVSVGCIWDLIGKSAWACADPALQFDDLYNEWHTCPAGEDGQYGAKHNRINATNPCSEYAFLDDTSCNLASINIYSFYNKQTKKFELDKYLHVIGLIQLVLEASVYWGQFPTADIARKTYMFRTTGLGIADLASLLMVMGYGYDSEQARQIASALAGILTGYSYYVSSLMASRVGPFEKYEINRPYVNRVLRNHARCALALNDDFEELSYKPYCLDKAIFKQMGLEELSDTACEVWKAALEGAEENGVRNAQVSVIAPTGTIAFAMDCGSTSVEPFYSHVIYKSLAGGGTMTITNPVLVESLKNLGYDDSQISKVEEYMLATNENGVFINYNLMDCPHIKKEHLGIFATANDISPAGHVLMVAAITPMISGSISKTVNLPASATVKDVQDVYLLAYTGGVKAISLYRDNCKATQPLHTGIEVKDESDLAALSYADLLTFARNCRASVPERMRPAGMRMSRTHSAKIGDVELYITAGFYPDGKMAEIFVSSDKEGTVVKGLLASLSKAISNMLQYNVPPSEISRILRGQQFEPSGFVSRHPYIKNASSIADLVSKVIDIELGDFSRIQVKPDNFTFICENTSQNKVLYEPTAHETASGKEQNFDNMERLYGDTCPNCGSARMYRNGTCKVCAECGTTTGCS
ncbi:MAG: vitamin B12-dependent ribonucleotide reductase [Eubacteriaceae bacterium]|nr:vitamin B12-dependent ribonucleotide reductase [Eubacteriaceae bacterium]